MELRRPLIAGNWKMNGLRQDSLLRVENIVAALSKISSPPFETLICPPATMLGLISNSIKGSEIFLGAQDCHPASSGAYTGDISAEMLADIGCSHVIVGHSERRLALGETDKIIIEKASSAIAANLIAIICVGESEDQRANGQTKNVILSQLSASLPPHSTAANMIIAYEPIWAIGTGVTPNNDDVQEIHSLIRKNLSGIISSANANQTRILYGGSVKPSNAYKFLSLPDVDGALVGGASLDWEDFMAIATCCLDRK
ncbi:triose-phosphate isomerase [Rhodospirillales bacterium]|nr:triose-phosphate isomerase [Rhodospirillales bacterium]